MKQNIILYVFAALMMMGCASKGGKCVINGTMPNDTYEGKYIFLVPMKNPDSVGVDSAQIKDRKFTFTTEKNILAVLRVDWHFRYGLQDLLVVCEPGIVDVTIDSISSGHGTENNNYLQEWKVNTQTCNSMYGQMMRAYREVGSRGDSVQANAIKAKADSVHNEYKEFTRSLANKLDDGPLKEFLGGMFKQ